MSQDFFTKTLFPQQNDGVTGQMLVQGKRGLSSLDKNVIAVLLIVVTVVVMLSVLFAPIIPVQVTTTETRSWKLLSYYKRQSIDDYSYYVNVTNYDSVGGTYTVTLQRTSGPWEDYETFEDTTQSMFIAPRRSGIFYAPDGWRYFTIEVTIPTKEENYTVTKTEYRSIISLIT